MFIPFLDFEVTDDEYKRWIEGYDFDRLVQFKSMFPKQLQTFKSNLCKRIIDARIDMLVLCLQSWFDAMEAGVTDKRFPNLDEPAPSKEKVNAFIERVDGFFETELKKNKEYWADKGRDMPPEFNRLQGAARLAFFQDYYRVKGKWLL